MPKEIVKARRPGLLARIGREVKALVPSVPFSRIGGEGYTSNLSGSMATDYGTQPGSKFDYRTAAGSLMENRIVAICLDNITQAFGQAPPILEQKQGSKWARVEKTHPIIALLENPNPHYTGKQLWGGAIRSMLTTGEGFWRVVFDTNGSPVQIYWEPVMFIGYDANQFIGHFEMQVEGQRYKIQSASNIKSPNNPHGERWSGKDVAIMFRHGLNPYNPRHGWTPLSAVLRQITGDNEAASYYASLMMNGAMSSLIVSLKETMYKDGVSMIEQSKVQELMAKLQRALTGDGRFRIAGTTLPVDIQKGQFSPKELALGDVLTYFEESVCAALRVPGMVAGLQSGDKQRTYSNFGEAMRWMWDNNIIPQEFSFADDIESQLFPLFGLDPAQYRIAWDHRHVPALAADVAAQWTRARQAFESQGIDLNEYRVRLGFADDAATYGGLFYVGVGQLPMRLKDGAKQRQLDAVSLQTQIAKQRQETALAGTQSGTMKALPPAPRHPIDLDLAAITNNPALARPHLIPDED